MTHTFSISTLVAGRFLSGWGQPALHKIGPKQPGLPGETLSQIKINKKNKTTKISFLSSYYNFFLTVNSFINHTFPDPQLGIHVFSQKAGGLSSQPVQKFSPVLTLLLVQYPERRNFKDTMLALVYTFRKFSPLWMGGQDRAKQVMSWHLGRRRNIRRSKRSR